MLIRKFFCALALCALPSTAFAKPKEKIICQYATRYGEVRQASSIDEVPRESRPTAQCRSASENENLAKPEDIKLSGNRRTEQLNTSVGEIQLRWPRKVESLFGRTPLRAMADAANTVSRAIKNSAFPSNIQTLNLKWQVVFMDESLPEGQIPTSLVTNCHPGWMTPPANIYIVAQRVAGGCGGQRATTSVADSTLAQVLVHEMGHAVEFYMLNQKGKMDRMRAEGWASWFERYASQYSSILNGREIARRQYEAARYALKNSPNGFSFNGSFEDYSRASLYFQAASEQRGVQGIMDVYQAINSKGLDFIPAILLTTNWDQRRLEREVVDLANKN